MYGVAYVDMGAGSGCEEVPWRAAVAIANLVPGPPLSSPHLHHRRRRPFCP